MEREGERAREEQSQKILNGPPLFVKSSKKLMIFKIITNKRDIEGQSWKGEKGDRTEADSGRKKLRSRSKARRDRRTSGKPRR